MKKAFGIAILVTLLAVLAHAGSDSIPTRSDGQTITADWSNLFKRVLSQDFLPRNSSGVVTDKAGSLGSSSFNWTSINTEGLKLRQPGGANQVILAAPSPLPSPYPLTFPSALPSPNPLPVIAATTGALSFGQVGTPGIADSAVTTAKIASGAITSAKREATNYVTSAASGFIFINTPTAGTDLNNLTVTITTTGRPVIVGFLSDGTDNVSYFGTTNTDQYGAGATVSIMEGSTRIIGHSFAINAAPGTVTVNISVTVAAGSLLAFTVPTAGVHTYKARLVLGSNSTFSTDHVKMFAFEL